MDSDSDTDSENGMTGVSRAEGLSVTCHSFEAALQVFDKNSSEPIFSLKGVPELSKKDPLEYEACSKFSKSILEVEEIEYLRFEDMTFDSDLVQFISKALSDYEGLYELSFIDIKVVSPEAAKALGEALKLRKPDESLKLELRGGDVSLFVPLMEASALIAGSLEFSNLDVMFVDTTRCLSRWALTATNISSVYLKNINGLSDASLNLLMKGLRNLINLSFLNLMDTTCSPGSLIILKESLSIILDDDEDCMFNLYIGNTGLNDAAVLRITELFVEYNKIYASCLNNVDSSVAKRLISTRVIRSQNLGSIQMEQISFLDETDFNLLFFALRTRGDCPTMLLSDDCFKEEDQVLLKQLETDMGSIMFY